jgi:hypothetical protein
MNEKTDQVEISWINLNRMHKFSGRWLEVDIVHYLDEV